MASMNLGPELQALVDRLRAEARERGELPGRPWSASVDPLPPEARAALKDWVSSGDYDRAVAELVADDPDLATQ